MCTSQPAISQRIANLEAELAATLFTRLARGVQLTPDGALLLSSLTEGLDVVEAALDVMRRPHGRQFTVASDFGFAAFWLMPRLPSLRETLAGVNVRIVTAQAPFDLQREPIDVAIAFGAGRWPGCVAEPLLREQVQAVCAPSLLDRLGRLREPRDLPGWPLLHLEASAETHWLDWPGWFKRLGVAFAESERRVTINNYSLLIQAALAGQGVALGWRPLIDDLLERGQLVAALDVSVPTENGYYAVMRRSARVERTATAFCAWLGDQLRADRRDWPQK